MKLGIEGRHFDFLEACLNGVSAAAGIGVVMGIGCMWGKRKMGKRGKRQG